jgi:hypothetical protein
MVAPVHAVDDVGFIAGRQFDVVVLPKTTGAAIAKGDVLEYVPGSDAYRTAAAGSVNTLYAVAVKPALAADTTVEAVSSGAVTVRADGAIGYGAPVMVSGATPGQVVEATLGTAAPDSIVGTYIGKVGDNQRNGKGGFPDAADNDVIIVDLNRRTS